MADPVQPADRRPLDQLVLDGCQTALQRIRGLRQSRLGVSRGGSADPLVHLLPYCDYLVDRVAGLRDRVPDPDKEVELGAQVKRTGSRYLNDINTIRLPGYTTADLDLRIALGQFEEDLENSYVQFNVTNIFDEVYIGSAPTGLTTSGEFVNIGAPRAFTASLIWGF